MYIDYHKVVCENVGGYSMTGIHRSAGIDSRFSFISIWKKLLNNLTFISMKAGTLIVIVRFDSYSKIHIKDVNKEGYH